MRLGSAVIDVVAAPDDYEPGKTATDSSRCCCRVSVADPRKTVQLWGAPVPGGRPQRRARQRVRRAAAPVLMLAPVSRSAARYSNPCALRLPLTGISVRIRWPGSAGCPDADPPRRATCVPCRRDKFGHWQSLKDIANDL